MSDFCGKLTWISEFVAKASLEKQLTMAEQVWVGPERLIAEVIALERDGATIQIYEDTTGLVAGDPVYNSGHPLSVLLGPGLLGTVFDGIQRPLRVVKEKSGIFIQRGTSASALDLEKRWRFEPLAETGTEIGAGEFLGKVQETELIDHFILVPPNISGELTELADEGEYTVRDRIGVIKEPGGKEHELTLTQFRNVRKPGPWDKRLRPDRPLLTGQRVVDTFFPLAKGGTAAIPGGFGAGKTVLQHSLAQWSDAQIIIFIGCGERGNEMTEVLEDFPELKDPRTGAPLMDRTILIANTSNMPVSARESSIYAGVTMAEYYRDQGYDVALMADSTSRWAQALREISGRLGEIPIEEGYPAYLPARIASFYERAGRVKTLGGKKGSITIIGAVSPPGGDFSEPVTRHTQRFSQCWWALDSDLAHKRHYPAIGWLESYSLHIDQISSWWEKQVDENWKSLRHEAMEILREESNLRQLVQLVGPDALSEQQQWVLEGARFIREGFLMQNALSDVDAYSVPEKQVKLLRLFLGIYRKGQKLIGGGIALEKIEDCLDMGELLRMREEIPNDELETIDDIHEKYLEKLKKLEEEKEDKNEDETKDRGNS